MKKIRFKKTKRERFPRKTKKWLLKYYTRSAYSEVVHLKERYSIGFDVAVGIDSIGVFLLGGRPVYHTGSVTFESFFEAEANHYKQLYNTPCSEVDAIVSELKESAKSHPKNISKEEEIAYMIGDTDVSASLVESVNRCVACDAFCECSLGMFPADADDEACRYFSNESAGNE